MKYELPCLTITCFLRELTLGVEGQIFHQISLKKLYFLKSLCSFMEDFEDSLMTLFYMFLVAMAVQDPQLLDSF